MWMINDFQQKRFQDILYYYGMMRLAFQLQHVHLNKILQFQLQQAHQN